MSDDIVGRGLRDGCFESGNGLVVEGLCNEVSEGGGM